MGNYELDDLEATRAIQGSNVLQEMVIEFDAARGGKVSARKNVNITQVIGD